MPFPLLIGGLIAADYVAGQISQQQQVRSPEVAGAHYVRLELGVVSTPASSTSPIGTKWARLD